MIPLPGIPKFLASYQWDTAQKFKSSYLGSCFSTWGCGSWFYFLHLRWVWFKDPMFHLLWFLTCTDFPKWEFFGVVAVAGARGDGYFSKTKVRWGVHQWAGFRAHSTINSSVCVFCQRPESHMCIYPEVMPEIIKQQISWVLENVPSDCVTDWATATVESLTALAMTNLISTSSHNRSQLICYNVWVPGSRKKETHVNYMPRAEGSCDLGILSLLMEVIFICNPKVQENWINMLEQKRHAPWHYQAFLSSFYDHLDCGTNPGFVGRATGPRPPTGKSATGTNKTECCHLLGGNGTQWKMLLQQGRKKWNWKKQKLWGLLSC